MSFERLFNELFTENGGVKRNTWKDAKNHKIYATWLGETVGYNTMEDWYKITVKIIKENYGSGLLSHYYKSSPIQFVRAMFPEYNWLEWKFGVASMNYWTDAKNHKIYATWLGETVGYNTMEDWYKITVKIIKENYGRGLAVHYKNSPIQFLRAVFPEYNWLEWKFGVVSMKYWTDAKNHKIYATWLGETMGYNTMEDWYKITLNIIIENYGSGLLSNYFTNSPIQFLRAVFPEYEWDISKFKKKYSVGQIEWLEYLKISIPDLRHILNHDDGEFKIPNSNYKADGFSDNQNSICEFNGDFWHGNLNIYNLNDINPVTNTTFGELYEKTIKKQKFCEDRGYKYYSIWESDWIRGKNALIVLQQKYKNKK